MGLLNITPLQQSKCEFHTVHCTYNERRKITECLVVRSLVVPHPLAVHVFFGKSD